MRVHVPPVVWFSAAAAAQRALPRSTTPPGPAWTVSALAVTAASGLVGVAALGAFHRKGTTVDPIGIHKASSLVTTGPNAISRNPMYLAMAGVLVAHAIHRGSATALVPLAGYVAALDRFQIAPEERALGQRFGADYTRYRARARCWI